MMGKRLVLEMLPALVILVGGVRLLLFAAGYHPAQEWQLDAALFLLAFAYIFVSVMRWRW